MRWQGLWDLLEMNRSSRKRRRVDSRAVGLRRWQWLKQKAWIQSWIFIYSVLLLRTNLIETLKLLTTKSKNQTGDILITYLSAIHQAAVEAEENDFASLLNQFFNVKQEYSGLIRDTLKKEVSLMTQMLRF